MDQPAQHAGPGQPFQVRARLAPPLAEALDLSDPKALPDEVIQRHTPHDEVAPCLGGRQLDFLRRQLLQRFGLHQGEIVSASVRVRESPFSALVTVTDQPAVLYGLHGRHHRHGALGLGGYRDNLDRAGTFRARPGPIPRKRSCSATTKAAFKATSAPSGGRSGDRPSVSATGSYTTPGGTPKNTAHVEDLLRRPRNRPGHLKLCGASTGTNPRFRAASHWFRRTPPSQGTSEVSTPSTCATQAVSASVLGSFFCSNSTLLS